MRYYLSALLLALCLVACNNPKGSDTAATDTTDTVERHNGVPVLEDPEEANFNLRYPTHVLDLITNNEAEALFALFDTAMLSQFNYTLKDAKSYLGFIHHHYGLLNRTELTDKRFEEVVDFYDPDLTLQIENYLYEAEFEHIQAAIYMRVRRHEDGSRSLYSYQVNPKPFSKCTAADEAAMPVLQLAKAAKWGELYQNASTALRKNLSQEEFTHRWKSYTQADPIGEPVLYWHTMVYFEGHAFLSVEYKVSGEEAENERVYTLEFDDRDGPMLLREYGLKLMSYDDKLIPEDQKQ